METFKEATDGETLTRYHHPDFGCILEFKRIDGEETRIYECVTCKRDTCHCGIEYGYHSEVYEVMKKNHDN